MRKIKIYKLDGTEVYTYDTVDDYEKVCVEVDINNGYCLSEPMEYSKAEQLEDKLTQLGRDDFKEFCDWCLDDSGPGMVDNYEKSMCFTCDLQRLYNSFMKYMDKINNCFHYPLDYLGAYNILNGLFHNNIPVAYLLNFVTDEMLAQQIVNQGLGKPRKTDKDYNDIVRRYVNKNKTLDAIDFEEIVEDNCLEEEIEEDLINKFNVFDEADDYLYLDCTDNQVIQYVQSFKPKKFDFSNAVDKRLVPMDEDDEDAPF